MSLHSGMGWTAVCAAALILFARAPLGAGEVASEPFVTFVTFVAYNLKEGNELFRGVRKVRRLGSQILDRLEYNSQDGTPLQRLEMLYDARNMELVSFTKVHPMTGAREGMVREGGLIRMTYLESAEAKEATRDLEYREGMAFNATVLYRLQADVPKLAAGEEVAFDLLVPSQLDYFQFRLRKEGEEDWDGRKVIVVRLEPDTWILRQVVGDLLFYVEAASPHRLLEYRGRTTVRFPKGEPVYARMVYAYAERAR